MRRTKIVATLGPATSSPERIAALIAAGMDVARLNFSHGTQADHAANIVALRQEAERAGRAVAILQDLQGPKIRTGLLVDGGPVHLVEGQTFTITTHPIIGDAQWVSTTYAALPRDVHPGDRVLLSDGLIELQVQRTTDTEVIGRVVHGGELGQRQGINLPGVDISSPAVTDKDIADLRFGLEQGVDYVAISFVRRAADVRQVKELIAQAGKNTPVIAKLEKPEALDELDEILRLADGVMVARGDMGVEMPPERVPIVQKQVIEAANRAAIPVITATQMLESMIHNPRPTRAEVSDVANAIIDGSDAVMLSGETAIGRFPVAAVAMMARIAQVTDEAEQEKRQTTPLGRETIAHPSVPRAVGAAIQAIARHLPVRAIWVFTKSGSTARLVAHYRPHVPILAFTPFDETYHRLSLLWGVTPLKTAYVHNEQEYYRQIQVLVETRGLAQAGDTVILTGGHPIGRGGPTNFVHVLHLEPGHASFVV